MCLGIIQTCKRTCDAMLVTCSVPILDKNLEFLGLHQESASLGANLEILDTCQEQLLVKTAFLTTPLSKCSPDNDALTVRHLSQLFLSFRPSFCFYLAGCCFVQRSATSSNSAQLATALQHMQHLCLIAHGQACAFWRGARRWP
jgi:hypothetical protein